MSSRRGIVTSAKNSGFSRCPEGADAATIGAADQRLHQLEAEGATVPVGAGVVHFVVDGADGCRTLLPAWMTEARAAALPMADIPRLSLSALRDPA